MEPIEVIIRKDKKPWYKNNLVIVPLLLFFPYIGIPWMWKFADYSGPLKIILTGLELIGIIYLSTLYNSFWLIIILIASSVILSKFIDSELKWKGGENLMEKCKHCQKEIDSKATKCPHCQSDLRSWPARHKILTGIFILILLMMVLSAFGNSGKNSRLTTSNNSNGSTQPTQIVAKTVKVGETYSSGNWQYEVTNVSKAKTITWSDYGNSTEAKGEFVIIYLTLKNIGKENFPINSFDFELRDSNNIKYNSDYVGSSLSSYKKLTSLGEQMPPGVLINTALVFDVAPDAVGLKLILKQADNTPVILE